MGPCTQRVYTSALNYSSYMHFIAKISTIWVVKILSRAQSAGFWLRGAGLRGLIKASVAKGTGVKGLGV